MYARLPQLADLAAAVDRGEEARPIMLCEYAHSMGNSTGIDPGHVSNSLISWRGLGHCVACPKFWRPNYSVLQPTPITHQPTAHPLAHPLAHQATWPSTGACSRAIQVSSGASSGTGWISRLWQPPPPSPVEKRSDGQRMKDCSDVLCVRSL